MTHTKRSKNIAVISFLAVVLLSGCQSHSVVDRSHQAAQDRRDFAYSSAVPLPDATPFDGDSGARSAYLSAYQDGYRTGLTQANLVFGRPRGGFTSYSSARTQGWEAGYQKGFFVFESGAEVSGCLTGSETLQGLVAPIPQALGFDGGLITRWSPTDIVSLKEKMAERQTFRRHAARALRETCECIGDLNERVNLMERRSAKLHDEEMELVRKLELHMVPTAGLFFFEWEGNQNHREGYGVYKNRQIIFRVDTSND